MILEDELRAHHNFLLIPIPKNLDKLYIEQNKTNMGYLYALTLHKLKRTIHITQQTWVASQVAQHLKSMPNFKEGGVSLQNLHITQEHRINVTLLIS